MEVESSILQVSGEEDGGEIRAKRQGEGTKKSGKTKRKGKIKKG